MRAQTEPNHTGFLGVHMRNKARKGARNAQATTKHSGEIEFAMSGPVIQAELARTNRQKHAEEMKEGLST